MSRIIKAYIDGKPVAKSLIGYDLHALQSKDYEGRKQYELHIPNFLVKEKFGQLYEAEFQGWPMDEELKEQIFKGDVPSFQDLLNNSGLLTKLVRDWFEYRFFDLFLDDKSQETRFKICSLKEISIGSANLIIHGTARELND